MIRFARLLRVGSTSRHSESMRWGLRSFSLTHVDEQQGTPRMVDVSDKAVTKRTASAKGSVLLPTEIAKHLEGVSKEIMSKKDSCKIDITLVEQSNNVSHPLRVDIVAAVKTTHRTGVEMEALTAVNVAALTVYDMLKALSQSMIITDVSLTTKTGGKSDIFQQS